MAVPPQWSPHPAPQHGCVESRVAPVSPNWPSSAACIPLHDYRSKTQADLRQQFSSPAPNGVAVAASRSLLSTPRPEFRTGTDIRICSSKSVSRILHLVRIRLQQGTHAQGGLVAEHCSCPAGASARSVETRPRLARGCAKHTSFHFQQPSSRRRRRLVQHATKHVAPAPASSRPWRSIQPLPASPRPQTRRRHRRCLPTPPPTRR